jgi:L1 cell adhesion molecule like protein
LQGDGKRNVFIFDLGGGTFDISILTIEDEVFEVKATGGDTHLGGEDFNTRMVDHCVEQFNRKNKMDMTTNKIALSRLRSACERAKLMLSSGTKSRIYVDSLYQGKDLILEITRATFEELNADYFRKITEAVEKSFRDAEMDVEQMHEIVLVGGSTRIPKVQQLLQDFFKGAEINKSVNPDEAVAYGAAVRAAILTGDVSEELQGLVLVDATPLSLGTDVVGGLMSVLIPRNTPIPTKHTKTYVTVYDNQTDMSIGVYEGERALIKNNNYLGHFSLSGIPPAPYGVQEVVVTFEIDLNNILSVTAVERSTGKGDNIIITDDRRRLSEEDIERMVKAEVQYRAEDEKEKQRVSAQNALESYCYKTKSAAEEGILKGTISVSNKNTILDKCNEVLHWLDDNRLAEKEEFEYQLKKQESVCDQMMGRMF